MIISLLPNIFQHPGDWWSNRDITRVEKSQRWRWSGKGCEAFDSWLERWCWTRRSGNREKLVLEVELESSANGRLERHRQHALFYRSRHDFIDWQTYLWIAEGFCRASKCRDRSYSHCRTQPRCTYWNACRAML